MSNRFTEIPAAEWSARQRDIVRKIESGPRGRMPINLRIWLHNPDFVDVVEPFGLYVSQVAPITKRQKELVVLVGARFWGAAYEWHMHRKHAMKAGFTDEQIACIAADQLPDGLDAIERSTYVLARALHDKGSVASDAYADALAALGHKGVADIIGLAGLYSMVAMTLNFYDVPPPVAPAEGRTSSV